MSRFSSKQKLSSIRVDKELLRRIEDYARVDLMRLCGLPDAIFSRVYSVAISDSVGTEVLHSISEHRPAQMSDTVQQIIISFDSAQSWDPKPTIDVDVDLSFSREPAFTRFSVSCKADTARDTVVGIRDSLLRILEPHWTHNRFFHPGPVLGGMGFALGWILSMLIIMFFANHQITAGLWVVLAALCLGAYVFAGRVLKPWTTFDTRLDRMNEEWWKWLKTGTLGFLVFGTLFTLFRKHLIGL